jgi:hypothetical protein
MGNKATKNKAQPGNKGDRDITSQGLLEVC